jgi:hypothetical protein
MLSALDVRVEGVYTDNPLGGNLGPGYYYSNGTWRSGYTDGGNLIGDWIGRAGQGAQSWATYHFAGNDMQFGFRHQKSSQDFPSSGGTITDVFIAGRMNLRRKLSVGAAVQYERWRYPVLSGFPEYPITISLQISYSPGSWIR